MLKSNEAASGSGSAASRAQQDGIPTRHQSPVELPAVGCNAGGAATVHKDCDGSDTKSVPAGDTRSDAVERQQTATTGISNPTLS